MTASTRIRWAGHEACMRKYQLPARLCLENEMHRDHFEDLGVDGMTILQRILKNNGRFDSG
jgi:hypothetical protein